MHCCPLICVCAFFNFSSVNAGQESNSIKDFSHRKSFNETYQLPPKKVRVRRERRRLPCMHERTSTNSENGYQIVNPFFFFSATSIFLMTKQSTNVVVCVCEFIYIYQLCSQDQNIKSQTRSRII